MYPPTMKFSENLEPPTEYFSPHYWWCLCGCLNKGTPFDTPRPVCRVCNTTYPNYDQVNVIFIDLL